MYLQFFIIKGLKIPPPPFCFEKLLIPWRSETLWARRRDRQVTREVREGIISTVDNWAHLLIEKEVPTERENLEI